MHVQHIFFLISKKNNVARAAYFFGHFLAVVFQALLINEINDINNINV